MLVAMCTEQHWLNTATDTIRTDPLTQNLDLRKHLGLEYNPNPLAKSVQSGFFCSYYIQR